MDKLGNLTVVIVSIIRRKKNNIAGIQTPSGPPQFCLKIDVIWTGLLEEIV